MKTAIVLIFLCLSVFCEAQKGYELIDRAEKAYEEGKYKRALRLIRRAEKANYGFCGNAWDEALAAATLLKASVYIEQERFREAREALKDGVFYFQFTTPHGPEEFDSIMIHSFKKQYGSSAFLSMIDTGFSKLIMNPHHDFGTENYLVKVPLLNSSDTLSFLLPLVFLGDTHCNSPEKCRQAWKVYFVRTKAYAYLMDAG